jgi:quercetin dioxygenase-like cupin family protein
MPLPLGALVPEEGYLRRVVVTPLLRRTTTAADQPIVYPSTQQPEVTAVLVEIPPGAETGWHVHPVPAYAYILSGVLEVEMEGGRKNQLVAGQALVESVNVRHNGRNLGKETVKLVMFVTGEKGKPFTVKDAKP